MASPTTGRNAALELRDLGQSVWLDYIRRSLLTSGQLARMVRDGWVRGMTSNPTIFEKAIAGSTDYDAQIARLRAEGPRDPYEAFLIIAGDDIRAAADVLRPVYDESEGRDGYVSFELPPGLEHDTERSVAEAHRLFDLVGRPNVMIKVPGTAEGMPALRRLVAEGLNPNMTLLFDVAAYEQCAEAYVAGLEDRLVAGLPLDRTASVASFFVSRVDTAVDALLPEGSALRGKAGVANARHAYGRFQAIFSGPRWERLAAAGARVQRPLWASTGTKNPAYSDVLYVDELVAPDTVNTMPEATLQATLDHGRVAVAIDRGSVATAEATLASLAEAGVDMGAVTARLLEEGLASFARDFQKLLDRLAEVLGSGPAGHLVPAGDLGPLAAAVARRLDAMARDRIVQRIWACDHTVWKPDPTEISDRLGWLSVAEVMREQVPALRAFADEVAAEGYRTAVLLGMGGSSLAPEVLHASFGTAQGYLDLEVLDTTDPQQIRDVEDRIDLRRTLFVVASKSGGTIETLSQLAYFWEKLPDGAHFVAITDPGTTLERLGRERGFRRVFANPASIGGRYSALSFFGLVPGALIGLDLEHVLDRAQEATQACHHSVREEENPAAWLGAALGEGALAGRDKLTLVLPDGIRTFGSWVEQLVAESTGKEGRGIVPIEGETLGPPAVYGEDRLFVAFGGHPELDALAAAGHPVLRIPYSDPWQLGGAFFRWELATAIAGHVLGINPFDQPNVQEAKDATARILAGEQVDTDTPPPEYLLEGTAAGDYVAITAYVDRNAANMATLQSIRLALRDRFRVATTVGFGPRFLHSTGQLHKGGANKGVFFQIVQDDVLDLPIPGREYTFGQLKRAQALGDLASLKAHGRRVARTTIGHLTELLR
ncbi:MAG: bifunctional transaldolase/phosoglucose isomerase [Dehalococcoidia bacterium]|nr:bifunctional transaldolase/phosoglucose isomerase [Dehalococcoidia bacterium]